MTDDDDDKITDGPHPVYGLYKVGSIKSHWLLFYYGQYYVYLVVIDKIMCLSIFIMGLLIWIGSIFEEKLGLFTKKKTD